MNILLIENERPVAELAARGLREQGLTVDVANDGQAGWEMARASVYDLVILDLILPVLSGLEVLKQLRRHRAGMPVLALGEADGNGGPAEDFEARADDYLRAPFAVDELLVRVNLLLQPESRRRSNLIQIGDLEIDRQTQQATRGGKRIDLTAKEYSLLEYLSANAGRVISRAMIIEHVWDESFQGLANIVDVYVRHLRSKVDDQNSKKLIRTVRGVGYSISDEVEA